MDFSAWSPSHTILVVVMVVVTAVGFIGQVTVLFHRTRQLGKRQDKQGETFIHAMERLEDRIDKRFEEAKQRLTDIQAEIRDVRSEMRQLNQNHIDHLSHHQS